MHTKVKREHASVDKMINQKHKNMRLKSQHIHEEMHKKLEREQE
jgi:hypothetical protein